MSQTHTSTGMLSSLLESLSPGWKTSKGCLGYKVLMESVNQKLSPWDFPGGTVVKNLPANAGDTGSIPGLGRSHVPQSNKARAQLLSLRSRACKPQLLKPMCLEPVLRKKRSHRNEKPAHRNEE